MSAVNAAAVIAAAVTLALLWARDDAHGYDQANRWGPDYDCSSFLISVWQQAGVAVKTAGATYTGNMRAAFLRCGFADVTARINLATGAGLQPGDVLLNERQHTAMYVGSGEIVHASSNELGKVTGGQTGDQTGREICLRPYYNAAWDCVLRYAPGSGSAASPSPSVGADAPGGPQTDAPGGPQTVGPSSSRLYTVTDRDSLWRIAEEQLGDPSRWPEIYELNGLSSTTIHPGQQLRLPPVSNLDHPADTPSSPVGADALGGPPSSSSPSSPSPSVGADAPGGPQTAGNSFLLPEVELHLPVLSRGTSGQIVRSLQALLLNAGCDVGVWGIDGDYGEDTWTAVCDFQRAAGLPVTGQTDGRTWEALLG